MLFLKMDKGIRAFIGMSIASFLMLFLALDTGRREIMSGLEKRADLEKDIKAWEGYFSSSAESYPYIYKMKLCDYLPMLKKLGDKNRIKKCEDEIIRNYPKVIKECDYVIENSSDGFCIREARNMKNTLRKEYDSIMLH